MQTEKTSVYLKIVNDFKRKIDLGLYGEGEQLPSCRDLAFKMGINPNTVQRAYTVLEEGGFIFTQPKRAFTLPCATKSGTPTKSQGKSFARLKTRESTRKY